MDEVADLFNRATKSNRWTARSARRFLAARGAAKPLPPLPHRRTPRRPWVTTRDALREAFPDLYVAILRAWPEFDLSDLDQAPSDT